MDAEAVEEIYGSLATAASINEIAVATKSFAELMSHEHFICDFFRVKNVVSARLLSTTILKVGWIVHRECRCGCMRKIPFLRTSIRVRSPTSGLEPTTKMRARWKSGRKRRQQDWAQVSPCRWSARAILFYKWVYPETPDRKRPRSNRQVFARTCFYSRLASRRVLRR